MSATTFSLKTALDHPLDCRALTPNKLAGLSTQKIAALPLSAHKSGPQVADYFNISGEGASKIIFAGDCTKLDFIGAGMQSGTIICQGNVGDRLGDQMRRGLILVDGNAGDYVASRMVAGTIGVFGKVGTHTGYMMRRGTLLLTQTPTLLPTMVDCGTHTLPFLRLLFASLQAHESKFAALSNPQIRRYCGDIANNGKGEILVLQTAYTCN